MSKRNLMIFIISIGLVASSLTAYATGEETTTTSSNAYEVIGSKDTINTETQEINQDTDSSQDQENQPVKDDEDQATEDQDNVQETDKPDGPIEPTEPVTPNEPVDSEIEKQPVVETNKNSDELEVVTTYELVFPENMVIDLGYKEHPVFMKYFLVFSSRANIRQLPNINSPIVSTSRRYVKHRIIETVKGQQMTKSDLWHKIEWYDKGTPKVGYVYSGLGTVREFQFEKMVDEISKLKVGVDNSKTAYISNYKNYNGLAPLINGKDVDKDGRGRSQSAPAYLLPNRKAEGIYLGDGHLVSILGNASGYYHIKSLSNNNDYWVPKKYVSLRNSIKKLSQVVVVDVTNQNEAVFKYLGDSKWQLVTFVYATTGANSEHKEPTELGNYMAIQKKDRFLYLDDKTKEIDGYAPYATRFNGGAYIHGVPVQFIKQPIEKEEGESNATDIEDINKEENAEEKIEYNLVDPGMAESLGTLGTIPLSHKCVRNFTSHAKYLYDWLKIGSSSIVVID